MRRREGGSPQIRCDDSQPEGTSDESSTIRFASGCHAHAQLDARYFDAANELADTFGRGTMRKLAAAERGKGGKVEDAYTLPARKKERANGLLSLTCCKGPSQCTQARACGSLLTP